MDPVTMAILAGIASGAARSGTDAGIKVIGKAYEGLKAAIEKKFGLDSDLADAVEKLEKKPDSPGRRATLEEEVKEAGADKDSDILAAAQGLLEQMQAQPAIQQRVQKAVGEYIAQAMGERAVARVEAAHRNE